MNPSEIIIKISAWVLVFSALALLIYFGCKAFLAATGRFIAGIPPQDFSKRPPENELTARRLEEQSARIQALSETEQIAYYYRVIQDLGYAAEISLEQYQAAVKEHGSNDAIEWVLAKYKKALDWEKFGEIENALNEIQDMIPGFTFKIKFDQNDIATYPQIRGLICGEPFDIRIHGGALREQRTDAYVSAVEVVYDAINPIISKKFKKQFMCLEPFDDSAHFVIVDDERAATVRAHSYFTDEEYWKHFYGYRKTKYAFA